ncbi:hypothetical protein LTR91_011606 [Friedmanniomyces endolithicus]|uniref:Apple domain-containing protein n=1 Tax=Friedmanniomyces endolithicus TaxID=329885 RepID=A0A4U0UQ10_9PEZI|nr:hypothetical protein LTS09_010103 [Friedmanniomyces endolithicus]KAK0281289.1 hypothetical protein LTR35_007665 [Friedmanniomyces endolithicus]KAK0295250.1 hypothetical protein LTS00_006308 [Friedmanniomyces endolithicus]KAK0308088.1 hypothetical protein LTR01_005421 [Friedmanniomyces endolithicus]KAK0318632.1 hypothetical protein LTR82_010374 [Friedmanniomyces endolithicus]
MSPYACPSSNSTQCSDESGQTWTVSCDSAFNGTAITAAATYKRQATVASILSCQALCDTTAGCVAINVDESCTLLSSVSGRNTVNGSLAAYKGSWAGGAPLPVPTICVNFDQCLIGLEGVRNNNEQCPSGFHYGTELPCFLHKFEHRCPEHRRFEHHGIVLACAIQHISVYELKRSISDIPEQHRFKQPSIKHLASELVLYLQSSFLPELLESLSLIGVQHEQGLDVYRQVYYVNP